MTKNHKLEIGNCLPNDELTFGKGGYLLNNQPLKCGSQTEPNGPTVIQVAYVPPKRMYEKQTNCCNLKNTFNVLVVAAFLIFFIMSQFLGYGFRITSGFICMDPSLSYKRQNDTISFWALMSGCLVVIPLFYLNVVWFLNRKFTKRGVREIAVFYKEYMKGMLLVLTVCEALKALIVAPRPDFFDVCNPDSAYNCTPGKYVETFTCQNFEKFGARKMFDANRSFPSGHGAMSVYTTIFCWYIIETRFPTKKLGEALKCVFLLAALAWSLFCSLTRITDRRHHYCDVLGGIAIGAFGGIYTLYVVYRKYDQKTELGKCCYAKHFVRSNSIEKSIVR